MTAGDDFWVFGYGSLMWDPGFTFLQREPALLRGYHRAFCIYSHRYRGTPDCPGLVLGLDRGGSCRGMVYRVAAALEQEVMDYLHAREMLHYVYVPKRLPVRLGDRRVNAHTYVADRHHDRFAKGLSMEDTARLILQGHGERGANREYLENTVLHLDELGIKEGRLHALRDLVRAWDTHASSGSA